MRFFKPMALALGLALASQAPAIAQPVQSGPVVVMDYQRILQTSMAGRDLDAKLRQIAETMQGELQAETTAVQTEAQALQAATQGRSSDQISRDTALRARIDAFNQRAEALRQQQMIRARDLDYTRQQALIEFNRGLEPIVQEVMTARRAAVVIDRSDAQLVADGVDATTDIVSRLDQRVRTVNVSRQAAPPPQGANGAPAPAAPPTAPH